MIFTKYAIGAPSDYPVQWMISYKHHVLYHFLQTSRSIPFLTNITFHTISYKHHVLYHFLQTSRSKPCLTNIMFHTISYKHHVPNHFLQTSCSIPFLTNITFYNISYEHHVLYHSCIPFRWRSTLNDLLQYHTYCSTRFKMAKCVSRSVYSSDKPSLYSSEVIDINCSSYLILNEQLQFALQELESAKAIISLLRNGNNLISASIVPDSLMPSVIPSTNIHRIYTTMGTLSGSLSDVITIRSWNHHIILQGKW
jgi:hypothetical protein